jgi:putative DNA-invertase from lambdoid prophage Rac
LSKLFYAISVAFAEAERDRIRKHILELKSDQRKRHRFLDGTVPFGCRSVKMECWSRCPSSKLRFSRSWFFHREGLSLRAIAAEIGGAISHVTVANIIKNAARCAR